MKVMKLEKLGVHAIHVTSKVSNLVDVVERGYYRFGKTSVEV